MPGTGKPEILGAKILVVEDDYQLLALLRRALEREGYDVIAAISGAEMMSLLATARPDLVVLDIHLPDQDGRDLLAELKKNPKTCHIPVVVWSGGDADSERRIALDLGAEDYVQKGPPSTLVPKIERILLRLSERQLVTTNPAVADKKLA